MRQNKHFHPATKIKNNRGFFLRQYFVTSPLQASIAIKYHLKINIRDHELYARTLFLIKHGELFTSKKTIQQNFVNSDHSFCKLQSLYILTQLYFYRSSCYYNLHTKLKTKQIISDAIINCNLIKTYSNIGVFRKRVLPNLVCNNHRQQKQKTSQFKILIKK